MRKVGMKGRPSRRNNPTRLTRSCVSCLLLEIAKTVNGCDRCVVHRSWLPGDGQGFACGQCSFIESTCGTLRRLRFANRRRKHLENRLPQNFHYICHKNLVTYVTKSIW